MPRRLPSIHSLIAFEAVARCGSFTSASEELCVTHGAISHRIGGLEKFIGASLFTRLHNGATLTDDGIALIESVGRALSLLESACAPKKVGTDSTTVTVSVLPHFASNWLLARVHSFSEHYPEIDLKIEASYELTSFQGSGIDVAIRYGMGSWPGLTAIKILDEEIFPVCSPKYLAKHGPFLKPAELSTAILLRSPRETWKPWFEEVGLHWDEPQKGPMFSNFGLLIDAAVLGHGIALGRRTVIQNNLDAGQLVKLFPIGIPAAFAYYIVYSDKMALRPEVVAFIDWVKNQATSVKRNLELPNHGCSGGVSNGIVTDQKVLNGPKRSLSIQRQAI